MDKGEKNKLIDEIDRLKKRLAGKKHEIKDLRVSNLFLGSLFDGISEEIMVIDQDFNIIDANMAFLNRYDLQKIGILGKRCHEIEQRSWAPCKLGDMPCPVERARSTRERVEVTHSFKDAMGETKEFIIIIYPVVPEGKNIDYFIEITRDVTEYRRLITRLQASEKRFRAIFDTANDAIISTDKKQRILHFNSAAQKIFGYSSHEVIGKDLHLLIPQCSGDTNRYVQEFLERKNPNIIGRTKSMTGLRKNGEEFPIELSLSFLEMEGEITFTGIVRDVSKQQLMEWKLLQSERLAAVGQAVAHVAHEIRNPLMIIGGFSTQIKTNLYNEKDMHKLDMVLEEVTRLERLVANLGDFTKEYRLVKRPADINSVLKDVIKIMMGVCSPGKYRFKAILSNSLEEIECDPDKLKQVFINIISNGIEAMQDGGVVSISTERIDSGVEIRINDEGVGIPNEDLQRIFEPFFTTRERGSGLGLSISYKLIEAHDGDIWASSSPGKGTTFIIQLPDA